MGKTFIEILKSDIAKFNPYHDRFGRFTTGSGFGMSSANYTGDKSRQAVTFSANPETTAGANAIARHGGVVPTAYGWNNGKPGDTTKPPEKPKQSEKPKEHNGMCPETLGGVKRGEPMSFEEANQGNTNPNYSKGGGYHINCQTCVIANEARRRGYDVTARPKDTPQAREIARDQRKAWIDPKTGKNPEYMPGCRDVKTAKQARKWLDENLKEGERYTLGGAWKGRGNSGHIITASKESNGKIKLYDPQDGEIMTDSNRIDSYLGRIKYTTTSYGMKFTLGIRVLRIDDKHFDTSYVDPILTKGE